MFDGNSFYWFILVSNPGNDATDEYKRDLLVGKYPNDEEEASGKIEVDMYSLYRV